MKLYLPENGAVVSLMTDQQKYFRAHTDELMPDVEYDWRSLVKQTVFDCSMPEKVRFTWEDDGKENHVLSVSRSEEMTGARRFDVTGTEFYWENGEIGVTYYWQVDDSEVRSFTTEDLPPRFIHVDGTTNVRDIGGWKAADGKVIRQGLLYRGSEFETHVTITEEGIRVLKEELGVRTDLDLRGEAVGRISESPLGKDVQFCLIPVKAYDELMADPTNVREVFAVLAEEKNYPVYFHCWGGADRTGTIAYLLGGILGVEKEDLLLDYELTSLSVWANRTRKRADVVAWLAEMDKWGSDPKEQSENFLRSLGVTDGEFENIRKILLG